MKRTLLWLIVLVVSANSVFAQNSMYRQLVNEGNQLFQDKHLSDAIEKYEEAVRIDSSIPEAYYQLGTLYASFCYETNKVCSEPIKYFRKVLLLKKNYKKTYFNLATCYLALEDYDHAISLLTLCIDSDGKNADAYFNRGFAFLSLGKQSEACSDFAMAEKLGNKDAGDYLKDCSK